MEDLFVTKNENKKLLFIEALYEEGEFLKALNELERYLLLYPRDLKALFLRGKMFRMLQSPNEARNVFLQLFPYISENKEYKVKILTELLYLEIQERNYLAAYSYLERLQRITDFVKGLNFDLADVYLKHQAKMEERVQDKANYFEKQIKCYDEESCIQRLLSNNASCQKKVGFRRFSSSLDLLELYEQIKEVLPFATITPAYNLFDTYIFDYAEAGYDEEGTLDYLQVLAYTNENEEVSILEISPFRAKKYKSYVNDLVDLEYQKLYYEESVSYTRKKGN